MRKDYRSEPQENYYLWTKMLAYEINDAQHCEGSKVKVGKTELNDVIFIGIGH